MVCEEIKKTMLILSMHLCRFEVLCWVCMPLLMPFSWNEHRRYSHRQIIDCTYVPGVLFSRFPVTGHRVRGASPAQTSADAPHRWCVTTQVYISGRRVRFRSKVACCWCSRKIAVTASTIRWTTIVWRAFGHRSSGFGYWRSRQFLGAR